MNILIKVDIQFVLVKQLYFLETVKFVLLILYLSSGPIAQKATLERKQGTKYKKKKKSCLINMSAIKQQQGANSQ